MEFKINLDKPTKALKHLSGNIELLYNTDLQGDLMNYSNIEVVKIDKNVTKKIMEKIEKKATENKLALHINYEYNIILLYFN